MNSLFSHKNLTRLIIITSILGTCGCMANVTRYTAPTPLQPNITPLPPVLRDNSIALVVFDSRDVKIEGGHHEGLLQVRQPWIFGLSKEQRDILYGNAGEVAALAFALELKRQGVPLVAYKEWKGDIIKADLLISGRVDRIVINTFGRGTIEGFGSAGNYWEATVYISDIQVKDLRSGTVLWQGNINSYAKMDNSPAKLDWNMLTLGKKVLNGALGLQKVQTATTPMGVASAAEAYVRNWEGTYTFDRTDITPVEVASRYAAMQFLLDMGISQNPPTNFR